MFHIYGIKQMCVQRNISTSNSVKSEISAVIAMQFKLFEHERIIFELLSQ